MSEDNLEYRACMVPDSELTPEQLQQRREQEEIRKKEESYDNSFSKVYDEGIGQVKLRPVTENTDFSNLKVVKYDWNFWMKNKPYQVVRVNGYPHRYDNDLYCYPLDNEDLPYNKKLIPFVDEWRSCLGNFKIEITPNPSYRIKWDEYRQSFCFIGKLLFDDGKVFYHCQGKTFAEVFSELQFKLNKVESHPVPFFDRNWKEQVVGMKIWYHNHPCVIKKVADYDSYGISFFIVSDVGEKIDCPKHWDDESGVCSKEAWEDDYSKGLYATWDCEEIKWFRK